VLERVRRGEPAAIDDLLRQAQQIARRYSQAVCGRAPDSDDAMQEALLKTFTNARRIREPQAFRSWLYRTVKNACLVGRRLKGFEKNASSIDAQGSEEPADHGPSADAILATAEDRDRIRGVLATLPPSQREVVFLRDLEGLSTREVSRVLGISEPNVKVRLHRAHRELRRQLGAGGPDLSPMSSERGARRRASPRSRTL
jgi:RNA polymerase sigma-70 factor (ECF subfamily)